MNEKRIPGAFYSIILLVVLSFYNYISTGEINDGKYFLLAFLIIGLTAVAEYFYYKNK